MNKPPEPQSFAPLSAEALAEFADIRTFINGLARDLAGGAELSHSAADLPALQAIASHEAMQHANYEAWVALGICFGDALADLIPGLHWRLVTDQYGTVAALQYRDKALSVFVGTMLWKRVERGDEMDLAFMANELKTVIEAQAEEARDE